MDAVRSGALSPEAAIAAWADHRRAHDPRHAALHGVVYTPPDLARRLAGWALDAAPPDARVLDPACGAGALLLAAARRLWDRHDLREGPARGRVVREQLRGWDLDAHALRIARAALARAAGVPESALASTLAQRDALVGEADRVDVVLANPPWVDAERMAAEAPEQRRALAERFSTAFGNWDLACVFAERALDLTGPQGLQVMLVPEKLAAAPYASRIRARLVDRGVRALHDLAHEDLGVAARPIAWVVGPTRAPTDVGGTPVRLDPSGGPWPLRPDPDTLALQERLSACPTLDEVAAVHGAATVAEAYDLRDHLREEHDGDGLRVVNSGTIDPFQSLWATRPLRYLRRTLQRPVVDPASLPERRRAQAVAPKLVVASMTRRLEVLPDPEGAWVPLKSTTVIRPHRAGDLPWLAIWLDSDAATRLLKLHHGATAFRGGHLRIGPPQLRDLPVPHCPDPTAADALVRARLRTPDDPAIRTAMADLVAAALEGSA